MSQFAKNLVVLEKYKILTRDSHCSQVITHIVIGVLILPNLHVPYLTNFFPELYKLFALLCFIFLEAAPIPYVHVCVQAATVNIPEPNT